MSRRSSRSVMPHSKDSEFIALDDPVPFGSAVAVVEPNQLDATPHALEQQVQRCLLQTPHVRFPSLVVRRLRDGVCLEGVMESDDECPDVCGLARQVSGVQRVINHLVIRHTEEITPLHAQQLPEFSPHQG